MTHTFDVEIARRYGMNAAVIFQNILYWCDHNRTNGRNEHDGLWWTYNSNRAFAEQFPYMTMNQVRYAIDKLVEAGLIVTGNYNTDPRDRTTWYAVTKLGYCICENSQMDVGTVPNATENIPKALPDINSQIVNPDVNESGAREDDGSVPTVEQAKEYADSIGYTGFNAEAFVNHYAARGWRSGGSPIVDWRAMVRVWRARDGQFTQARAAPANPELDYQQRDYNAEDWDAWFAESERRMAELYGGTG